VTSGASLSAVRVHPDNREVVRSRGSQCGSPFALGAWHLGALALVIVTARTVQGMARAPVLAGSAWFLAGVSAGLQDQA
jgi:hypothetical protein